MKKLLMVISVVGFVACNNSADSTTATDTTTVKPDSTATTIDTAAAPKVDTASVKADTTKKVDSLKK